MKTKRNFGKRALSLFLSAIMVVTMLPTFAITASAESAYTAPSLAGKYLTKDASTGVTNNGITWDAAKNAAYFDGTSGHYLAISGKPFESVTSSTGFAVSFDVMLEDSINAWGRIIDFNNYSSGDSASEYFFVNGGDNWNPNRLLQTEAKYNGGQMKVIPGSTTALTRNKFQNVVVIYKNGETQIWVESNGNYTNIAPDEQKNAISTDAVDHFADFTNYWIGKSSYTADNYFKGYLKNVYLFKSALSLDEIKGAVSADKNYAYREYLTDSNMTNFEGTATWSNDEKAWYFSNNNKYLKLNENPLRGASVDKGFAISFDVRNNDTDEVNSQYFHFDDGGSNAYYMNAADTTWYVRYRSAFQNSTNTRWYYTSDFNSTYCDSWVATNGANGYMNDMVTEQKWYTYTLVMNTDGSYEYFIDGVSKGKFKTNYANVDSEGNHNGNGITDANVTSIIQSLSNFYIGASNGSGSNGFNGYIKNFKVISDIRTGTPGALALLVARYEGMMNGTVYKNMAPAYKAYVDACEALDAYNYGGSYGQNSAQIANAYSALNTAISGMTEWSAPAFSAKSYYYSDEVGSGYYSNVVYSTSGDSGGTVAQSSSKNCNYYYEAGATHLKLIAPTTTVLVYDGIAGHEVSSPIVAEVTYHDKLAVSSQKLCYIASKDSTVYFDQQWYGYNYTNETIGDNKFNWKNWPITANNHFGYSTSDGDNNRIDTRNDTPRFFKNKLIYHGTGNTNTYYDTYNSLTFTGYAYYSNWGDKHGSVDIPTSFTDYVINYKQVITDVNTLKTRLAAVNVANYKEGGLSNIIAALDFFTTSGRVNPNSYIDGITIDNTTYSYSSNVATAVAKCASEISSAHTNYSGTTVGAADTADNYVELRDAFDYYGAPTGLNTSDLNGKKYHVRDLIASNGYVDTDNNGSLDTQLTGFGDFLSAYLDAAKCMADLGASGLNNNSNNNYTDGSNASQYADDLIDAFNGLNLVELHTPVISINNTSGIYVDKNHGVTIAASAGETPQYSVRTSTDGGTSWTSWSSFADYSAELKPFKDLADDASSDNWAEYKTRSADGSGHYSDESAATQVKFLAAPSVDIDPLYETDGFTSVDELTINSENPGISNGIEYSFDNFAHYAAYSEAIAPFGSDLINNDGIDNTVKSKLTIYVRQKSGTSVSPVYSVVVCKNVRTPGFSVINDEYLDADDTVSFTPDLNTETDETITYDYSYGNMEGPYTAFDAENPLVPFSGYGADAGAASRTIYARAIRNGKYSLPSYVTVHYLSRPSVTIGGITVSGINALLSTDRITVTQTSGLTRANSLQYSFDNSSDTSHWNSLSSGEYFCPFSATDLNENDNVNNSNATELNVYVRQYNSHNGSYSPVLTFKVYKRPSAPVITPDGAYVDNEHGVSAALTDDDRNDADVPSILRQYGALDYGTYSGKVTPFGNTSPGQTPTPITVNFKTRRKVYLNNGDTIVNIYSPEVSYTLNYLSSPEFDSGIVSNNGIVSSDNVLNLNENVTVRSTNGSTTGVLQYSFDNDHWENGSTFAPFNSSRDLIANDGIDNTTAYMMPIYIRMVDGTSKSPVMYVERAKLQTTTPSIRIDNTTGNYVDKNHGVIITNSDTGAATIMNVTKYYKNGENSASTITYDFGAEGYKPFANNSVSDENPLVRVDIVAFSRRESVESPQTSSVTINYLSAPTVTNSATSSALADNDELTTTDTLSITSTNSSGGTIKYYVSDDDGANWRSFDYSAAVNPFTLKEVGVYDYTDDVKLMFKATQVSGDWESEPIGTYTILRKLNTVDMYWKKNNSDTISFNTYSTGGRFFINNTLDAYSGRTIYYQKSVDGVNDGTFYTYNINTGIGSDDFASNEAVTFKFYVIQNTGKTIVAKASFSKQGLITDADNNMLAYHESFDDASINGTSFTSPNGNGTLANSGTAAIETGTGGEYDYRKNVLKINSPTINTVGNYIQLTNPLSVGKNIDLAKSNGITISFWRHMNEDCGTLTSAMAFTSYDSGHTGNRYKFIMLTADGKLSYADRNSDGNGGGYLDYKPWPNDITNHSIDAHTGYWSHIALTVDPNKSTIDEAFTMYINGEPHEIDASTMKTLVADEKKTAFGSFASMTEKQVIDAFMEFITAPTTHFDYGYSAYNDNSDYLHNIWYDDVRIYTKVKTQVDINNMYTDSLSDSYQTNARTSASHDPMNVTVYVLKSGFSYTVPDGSAKTTTENQEVGQEFIDYYNVPASQIKSKVYYSFGTGLTIYKSTDNKNWIAVGDSQGRFGYQNQELFVANNGAAQPYYTTLSVPLAYSATDTTSDSRPGAAGHLVWAPHVMYNLKQDKWMYYGSTSSWNSGYSDIFVLSSATVDHGYKYLGEIVKTATGNDTNAIDACVYYGHNANGTINPNDLYCLYGSWSTNVRVKSISDDGTSVNTSYISDSVVYKNLNGGGGEGGYVIYKYDATANDGAGQGYYYFYISPGANGNAGAGGAYHIRTYRSTEPNAGFKTISNTDPTVNETPHGNSFITGYENTAASDYVYTSIGHSSVYFAYNADGEPVLVNAAHAREYTRKEKPTEDAALATRQIWLIGNVAIHNPVLYTKNGWPVAMPMQYDNTFSTKYKGKNYENWIDDPSFAAFDVEGTYAINDMLMEPNPVGMGGSIDSSKDTGFSTEKTYTVIADDDTTGVFMNNETGTGHKFVLEPSADKSITYVTLYEADGTTPYAYGVFANQGEWGDDDKCKMEFSLITVRGTSDSYGGRGIWGVRTAKYPRDVVNAPQGQMVKMDEVVYTHKANNPYTMYGQEISDDINYLDNTGDGERVTTIKVSYPFYIDTKDPNAIICLNDVEFMEKGYSSGNYKASPVRNRSGGYYYDSDGTGISDAVFDGYTESQKKECYRFYVLTGDVSNYFHYFNNTDDPFDDKGVTNVTGYPEHGLKLLIQYVDGARYIYNDDDERIGENSNYGKTFGEYKFPFVMPNPGEAHTVVGIRNNQSTETFSGWQKIGITYFTRFNDSYGSVNTANRPTAAYPAYSSQNNVDNEAWFAIDSGNFKYLHNFENNSTALSTEYGSKDALEAAFNKFGASEGVASGAYTVSEQNNGDDRTYLNGSYVVDADYYIDYSDESNSLITRNGTTPTGYKLKFYSTNLSWKQGSNTEQKRIMKVSSYFNNQTGLEPTITSTDTTSDGYIMSSNSGSPTTNGDHLLLFDGNGNSAFSELRSDLTNFENTGTDSNYKTAFSTAASPFANSSAWDGSIVLSGKSSISKATEKKFGKSNDYNSTGVAANFIYEQGYTFENQIVTSKFYTSHETYHYYNIGVSTCDKGAVRNFTKRWAYKEMLFSDSLEEDAVADTEITEYSDAAIRGTNTVKGVITRIGAKVNDKSEPQYINAANYSVESYNEYLDALAKAYWFVYNPKNTHLSDYDSTKSNDEYTTAYGNVNGGYNQMIYHAEQGDDIFRTGKTNVQTDVVQAGIIADVLIAYKNLFSIDDYKKIKDNYDSIHFCTDTEGETDAARGATVSQIHSILIKATEEGEEDKLYTDTGYTADSWEEFITFIKAVVTDFDYYTDDTPGTGDHKGTDINEWRYVPLDGTEYKQLDTIISAAKDSLMPKIDTTQLTTLINDKTTVLEGGIYENEEQAYSYGSWKAIHDRIPTATALKTPTTSDPQARYSTDGGETYTEFDVGKYDVTGVSTYTFSGNTLYIQNFDSTAFNATNYTAAENCSAAQKAVYDELNVSEGVVGKGDNTEVLGGMILIPVSSDEKYTTFSYAETAADSVDSEKYTDSAFSAFETELDRLHGLAYYNITADDVTEYYEATGDTLTAGAVLKNSGNIESQTTALLSAISALGEGIKQLWVSLTVQEEDSDTPYKGINGTGDYKVTVPYGTSHTISLPTLAGDEHAFDDMSVDKWSITYYSYDDDKSKETATGSTSKISGVENSITRAVNNNMAVTAIISRNTAVSSDYKKLVINDIYNNVRDVYYIGKDVVLEDNVDTKEMTIDGHKITAPDIPFYSFTDWTLKSDDVSKVYTYKPNYTAAGNCNFTIIGTTANEKISKTIDFDKRLNLSYSTEFNTTVTGANDGINYAAFKAWAVRVNYGTTESPSYKYQIASYNPSYYYYAVVGDDIVPILSVGANSESTHYVAAVNENGAITDELTPAMIDGAVPSVSNLSAAEVLKYKLDNRRPFISVQKALIQGSKSRAYVRLTTNATAVGGYGVVIKNNCTEGEVNTFTTGSGILKRTVSNILSTGQFTYTLNNKDSSTGLPKNFSKPIGYRAFVTYDVTYTAEGKETTINIIEYSNGIRATVPTA